MNANVHILICDDDYEIANAIGIYMSNEGYQVHKCHNGAQAVDIAKNTEIHLIIMDIMMPVMDGMEATQKIRQFSNVPVIMLTAKSQDMDTLMGLQVGADDYVTKPFKPMELIARVKSQLRRYTLLGSYKMQNPSVVFTTGTLSLNDARKEVTVDGEMVKLTPVEYKIMCFLMTHMGHVFSIDQIYEAVWNEPSFHAENTVAVHIRRIREKIEINPKEPKYLKVVWGIGYKIEKL